jgi:hypothetical protein
MPESEPGSRTREYIPERVYYGEAPDGTEVKVVYDPLFPDAVTVLTRAGGEHSQWHGLECRKVAG